MASKKGKPKQEKPPAISPEMPPELQKLLVKQHYHLVGRHSAVKVCEYLRRSLFNRGACYKQKFYGIDSHRCLQMTPAVSWCTESCVFCWRPVEWTLSTPPKQWDEPDYIVEESVKAQRLLISGYGGLTDRIDAKKWEEAQNPNQVAISLSGEPTYYPYIGELIDSFHRHGFDSSFLVTNGTFPERLMDISREPTQLYLSIESPTERLFRLLNRPLIPDAWERLNRTIDLFPLFKCRTAVRMTMVKGWNDKPAYIPKFAEMIRKAEPDFLEIKSYMCVGYSRKRLTLDNMLSFAEIMDYAEKMAAETGYKLADSSELSRVALLKK